MPGFRLAQFAQDGVLVLGLGPAPEPDKAA